MILVADNSRFPEKKIDPKTNPLMHRKVSTLREAKAVKNNKIKDEF